MNYSLACSNEWKLARTVFLCWNRNWDLVRAPCPFVFRKKTKIQCTTCISFDVIRQHIYISKHTCYMVRDDHSSNSTTLNFDQSFVVSQHFKWSCNIFIWVQKGELLHRLALSSGRREELFVVLSWSEWSADRVVMAENCAWYTSLIICLKIGQIVCKEKAEPYIRVSCSSIFTKLLNDR